eukprot:gnl/MRDRNA2_/MRDRNA2_209341_c0_seq1.p1 gnl/MRDRNA2_/MRDRNA2_209341_c0~~gnl/MRDRNA2_/MRDRNA2_209341_c0_seq1.p1  ORF type:complete len:130 (-),score=22.91 gnl/MRDRNA2_/MRDRNA2_209341_c0_seq1:13-402(-)
MDPPYQFAPVAEEPLIEAELSEQSLAELTCAQAQKRQDDEISDEPAKDRPPHPQARTGRSGNVKKRNACRRRGEHGHHCAEGSQEGLERLKRSGWLKKRREFKRILKRPRNFAGAYRWWYSVRPRSRES